MLERREKVRKVMEELLDLPSFTQALIADGWTQGMAESGFRLHEKTWLNIDSVTSQIEKVDGKEIVEKVCHIWPALPGAGVSPIIFGALCGVKTQHVKPSRRGKHFAKYFVSVAEDIGVSFSDDDLFSNQYERLIVSGTNETIAYFRERHDNVIGFGHRESIAVVDSNFRDFNGLAMDIAQWDQQGCFSVRTVFYIGEDSADFCQSLTNALFEWEGDSSYGSGSLTERIQKRALLEMTGDIFIQPKGRNGNCAFVSRVDSLKGTWKGGAPAAGCVEVRTVNPNNRSALFSLISLPSHQRQGVALSFSEDNFEAELLNSGFTHISKVGQMQSPPLTWLHDGRSNVDMFLKS